MPGTMTENENLLSLLSIEVLISQVEIDMNIPCHLPCMVFRLLDYPAVSIPFFDQWQIEEFHELKRIHPNVSWRQLLADQFYELRSANGKFNFKRGKSCLFKTYFKNLYNHLLNVPLFLLLIDQINNSSTNVNTTQFIGSCNVKLNELIEVLNQSIIRNGTDIPLVEQETFHCTLFNLMGTKIGTCDVAVRFCHYGTTILTHLPMLDDGIVKNMNDKSSEPTTKEKLAEVSKQTTTTTTSDTVVKHIHFVNEKKDVGLQISRSDLPSTSNTNKSAQTRWTSTKTHPLGHHHQFKGRYPRTIEDSIYDDTSIASYQPPALYFNSNSDFLQMMTPANAKTIEEAKEDRLSYLASIPIASFQDEIDFEDPDDEEDDENQQPPKQLKSKVKQNVRFQLTKPSTPLKTSSQIKISPKKQQQQMLAKDFLHNFPLLRALVEEALALQDHEYDVPLPIRRIMLNERPHSAGQIKQRPTKSSPTRPKSAANIRSAQPKSVIVSRNINNTNRLYPSSVDRRQMIVTKHEVRNLVDRLSKPKFNKRLDREIADAEQIITADESIPTPRLLPKPIPAPVNHSLRKKNRITSNFIFSSSFSQLFSLKNHRFHTVQLVLIDCTLNLLELGVLLMNLHHLQAQNLHDLHEKNRLLTFVYLHRHLNCLIQAHSHIFLFSIKSTSTQQPSIKIVYNRTLVRMLKHRRQQVKMFHLN